MSLVLFLAAFLDFLFGDPDWITHPVIWMGRLISLLEKRIRPWCEKASSEKKKKERELVGGGILAALMCLCSYLMPLFLLWILGRISPVLSLLFSLFLAFYLLAARTLAKEARGVYEALEIGLVRDCKAGGMTKSAPEAAWQEDMEALEEGRRRVARIVGRDTKSLTREGVIRATVETVAENTTDGVIAPLFYLALGGVPLMCLYKAINTMDSMLGYRNEAYLYFGRVAARLDDLANLIPSRLAALLMILATPFLRLDLWGAMRCFWKYRYAHKSPNSAQTESVMAGALGVELGGDASYFGRLVKKPAIGEGKRPIEAGDILLANRLLWGTEGLFLLFHLLFSLRLPGPWPF